MAEERRRTDEERRRASHFEDEAESLRDKVRDCEDSLAEERERRRRAEERFASAQSDYDTRLRSTIDSWEQKLRRSREEVEADLRDKQRLADTRAQDDLDEARSEAKEAKARKPKERQRDAKVEWGSYYGLRTIQMVGTYHVVLSG